MGIELDHATVPARDRRASAELLGCLLGVAWAEARVGPFCAVYVNDGLTLDFDQADGPFPVQHYCFRVSEVEFAGIVERLKAKGVPFRSTPHGPVDMQVNTRQRRPDRVLESTRRPRTGGPHSELCAKQRRSRGKLTPDPPCRRRA